MAMQSLRRASSASPRQIEHETGTRRVQVRHNPGPANSLLEYISLPAVIHRSAIGCIGIFVFRALNAVTVQLPILVHTRLHLGRQSGHLVIHVVLETLLDGFLLLI